MAVDSWASGEQEKFMAEKMEKEYRLESCPNCQVGTLHPGAVSYFALMGGAIITIPSFPAWICDVCRHCEYDAAALEELRVVLGPSAQLPSIPGTRRRLASEIFFPWSRTETHKGSK
jgi:YgiT-type zinc finger domain-containing protein